MAISAFTTPSELKLQDFYVPLPLDVYGNVLKQKQDTYDANESAFEKQMNLLSSIRPAAGSKDEEVYYKEFLPKINEMAAAYADKDLGDAMVFNKLKRDIRDVMDVKWLNQVKESGAQQQAMIEEYNKNPEKYDPQLSTLDGFKGYDSRISGAYTPGPGRGLVVKLDDSKLIDSMIGDISETSLQDGYYKGVNRQQVDRIVNANVDRYVSDSAGKQKIELFRRNNPEALNMSDEAIAKEILTGHAEKQIHKIENTQMLEYWQKERMIRAEEEKQLAEANSTPWHNTMTEVINSSTQLENARITKDKAESIWRNAVKNKDPKASQYEQIYRDLETGYRRMAAKGTGTQIDEYSAKSLPVNLGKQIEGTNYFRTNLDNANISPAVIDPIVAEKQAMVKEYNKELFADKNALEQYKKNLIELNALEKRQEAIYQPGTGIVSTGKAYNRIKELKQDNERLKKSSPNYYKKRAEWKMKGKNLFGESFDITDPNVDKKIAEEYNMITGEKHNPTSLNMSGNMISGLRGTDVVYRPTGELKQVGGVTYSVNEAVLPESKLNALSDSPIGDTDTKFNLNAAIEQGVVERIPEDLVDQSLVSKGLIPKGEDAYRIKVYLKSGMDSPEGFSIYNGQFMDKANLKLNAETSQSIINRVTPRATEAFTEEYAAAAANEYFQKNHIGK